MNCLGRNKISVMSPDMTKKPRMTVLARVGGEGQQQFTATLSDWFIPELHVFYF
jgi:hypothetical protein